MVPAEETAVRAKETLASHDHNKGRDKWNSGMHVVEKLINQASELAQSKFTVFVSR